MNIFDANVLKYQKKGWILLNRNDTTAQLRKPKAHFSCLPNIIWSTVAFAGIALILANNPVPGGFLLVIGVISPILYFMAFLSRHEKTMTLFVDATGRVRQQ